MEPPEPTTPPAAPSEAALPADPAPATVAAPAGDRGANAAQGRRQVLLFLALLLCYGFFIQRPAWNEYSRYDLVRALVEQGTVQIDDFHDNTGDVAFKDGHWYSDKAPGTALIGVPVYAALVAVNRLAGHEPPPDQVQAVAMLSFAVSGIPTALLVLLLVRFLVPYTGEAWALFTGAAYGLGTIAFPFATMYFGHAASAFFLFAAFYALWSARRTGGGTWRILLAGFLGGWGVITEFSAALGVLVLGIYALLAGPSLGRIALPVLRRLDVRTAVLFAIGGILPALLLFAHNALAFGSPFSLGYANLQSGGFAEGMSQGILGVTMPKLDVLADLLVGPRGLFRLSPWLALAPLGLVALRRREVRAEVLVAAAICVAFLAFNAGYYLPFGGWTPGPRFLMPALPFMAALVALAPRRFRPVTVVLASWSIAVTVILTATRPNAQEIYTDPLVQVWLPRILSGHLAESIAWERWGVAGFQPLLLLVLGVAIAVAAMLATRSRDRVSNGIALACAGILGVLVLAFAVPAPSPRETFLGYANPTSPARVLVSAAGAYPQTTDSDRLVLWAQLENAGGPAANTRIEFRVQAPGEAEPRAAWYGKVPWSPGRRDATELAMELEGTDPSTVTWEIRIIDEATGDVLGSSGVRTVSPWRGGSAGQPPVATRS